MARALRASMLLDKGKMQEAQMAATSAIAADGSFGGGYGTLAQIHAARGATREALSNYDRANLLPPRHPSYLNAACWVRAAELNSELAKARSDCDAALKLAPRMATFYDSRGMVGLRERSWTLAYTDYDTAVRLDARDASPVYGRGLAAIALGFPTEGQVDLAQAEKLDPSIASVYAKRGLTPATVGVD